MVATLVPPVNASGAAFPLVSWVLETASSSSMAGAATGCRRPEATLGSLAAGKLLLNPFFRVSQGSARSCSRVWLARAGAGGRSLAWAMVTIAEAKERQQATALASQTLEQLRALPWDTLKKGLSSSFPATRGDVGV